MSDSEEIDPEILELLAADVHNREQRGKLENIIFTVFVNNKAERLRKRFSGDDHVSDIAQAIADQAGIGGKTSLDLICCGKRLKMDQLVSSLHKIKGDGKFNPPIVVVFPARVDNDEKKQECNIPKNVNRLTQSQNEVVIRGNKEFTADVVHRYDILKITGKDNYIWSPKVSVKGWNKKTGAGGKLLLHCRRLVLEGGASINVDGKGYSAGYSIEQNKLRYREDSNELLNTYGDAKQFELNGQNVYLGSGGECDPASAGWFYVGEGGGVIVIKCDDAIIIEKGCTISANGTKCNEWIRGGSGGSIYLHAPIIVNNGKVTANGASSKYGRSGGFGRIRVDCNKEHQKQLANNPNFNPKIEYFG